MYPAGNYVNLILSKFSKSYQIKDQNFSLKSIYGRDSRGACFLRKFLLKFHISKQEFL